MTKPTTSPAALDTAADTDGPAKRNRRGGKGTSTVTFGTGQRVGHDASRFYDQFEPLVESKDETVNMASQTNMIVNGDARSVPCIPDSSVGLVVTSPPYFAGKEYEKAGNDGTGGGSVTAASAASSYRDHLRMLDEVFDESWRQLEPGGRIAVNVANLGRKPFINQAAHVEQLLVERGFIMRGVVWWIKGRGAGGSCAWGTFRSPVNPVLRDVGESIVIASKGRLDRALHPKVRAERGLPSEGTPESADFMDQSLQTWYVPAESAKRIGHPAPFPIEIPRRLIEFYTFKDDLVVDPFGGSGTTAIAAANTGRRWCSVELDPGYAAHSRDRVGGETGTVPEIVDSQGRAFRARRKSA